MATLYITSNAFHRWSKVSIGWAGLPYVTFSNPETGYLMLNQGSAAGSEYVVLLRTTDRGRHWRWIAGGRGHPTPISKGIKSGLLFRDRDHGWITGTWYANSIMLYETDDGGEHWKPQPLAIPEHLSADGGAAQSEPPVFFGSQDGILPVELGQPARSLVLYRTTNGGTTWTPTRPVGAGLAIYYSVVDARITFATDGHSLFRTANGGATWSRLSTNLNLGAVTGLNFLTPSRGWAVVNGQVWDTNDGGGNWLLAAAGK